MEQWKIVTEVPAYEVSSLGRVRRVLPGKLTSVGKIIKPRVINSGYLSVCLTWHCKRYRRLVHVLVARAFVPNVNNLPEVNHIDGNKLNPLASNLEWSNGHLQQMHAMRIGRITRKGYRFDKRRNTWQAHITVNGKFKHLGYFVRVEDAKEARLTAELAYWPELHHLPQDTTM